MKGNIFKKIKFFVKNKFSDVFMSKLANILEEVSFSPEEYIF